jgi:hypothetical protein
MRAKIHNGSAEHRLKLATLSARQKLLSWAKHKQRIDLHCAKEKSAKSESGKCSDINEGEENYGDDKTHRTQDGTHCPQDGTEGGTHRPQDGT